MTLQPFYYTNSWLYQLFYFLVMPLMIVVTTVVHMAPWVWEAWLWHLKRIFERASSREEDDDHGLGS